MKCAGRRPKQAGRPKVIQALARMLARKDVAMVCVFAVCALLL